MYYTVRLKSSFLSDWKTIWILIPVDDKDEDLIPGSLCKIIPGSVNMDTAINRNKIVINSDTLGEILPGRVNMDIAINRNQLIKISNTV